MAYYIATVWVTVDEPGGGQTIAKQIVRKWATGPDDYRAQIRELWPDKVGLVIGPVSLSKVQP
jgi:hypothetical protein